MKDLSYLTDHYDEKIKRIKEIDAPLNFIFFTDPHNGLTEWDCPKHKDWAPDQWCSPINAAESMQYIIDRVPNLQCVVCGGDLGCDYNTDPEAAHKSIEDMMEALYKLSVPVHCLIGNHDDCVMAPYFDGADTETLKKFILYPKDLHQMCMKYNPTEENYYYTDFTELGYRFVFLNTSDFYYGFDENDKLIHPIIVGISREQALWFEKVVKTDLKVVVFSHSPISIRGHYPDCAKGREDMANGPWVWHTMAKADSVVASISGHLHYDNVVYDGPVVAISTTDASSLYHGQWDVACPRREFGTITETAFDVVSIKDEVIYCTRFGSGTDRIARIMRNYQTINKEWVK